MSAEYTEAERRILTNLGEAANDFARLPMQHPNERNEFVIAIHAAQTMVMARLAQRADATGLTPVIDTWGTPIRD